MKARLPAPLMPPPNTPTERRTAPTDRAEYEDLEATLLHCPGCRQAMPVRKRLLLVLPDGDKYEYTCRRCATVCGDKIERTPARGPW